jgi:hypothetical protein
MRPDISDRSAYFTTSAGPDVVSRSPFTPFHLKSKIASMTIGYGASFVAHGTLGKRRIIGEVERMEESYGEGGASHTGPESCGEDSNVLAEALIGVRAGRVLSREVPTPGCRCCPTGRRQHWEGRERETCPDPARSETSSTYGTTSHGNREIPWPPLRERPHREA